MHFTECFAYFMTGIRGNGRDVEPLMRENRAAVCFYREQACTLMILIG